jgi:hypothetical protein
MFNIMTVSEFNLLRRRECEEIIPKAFHVYLPISEFLFDDIETGPHSYAVLFKSGQDAYALILTEEGYTQTLNDVRRIVKGMGLEAQRFFPPGADPLYFYEEGVKHFLDVYPGRKQWKKDDITFYQSLADYSTALVRLSSVNGEIRRFNTHSSSWQKAFDFSFRKIPVA